MPEIVNVVASGKLGREIDVSSVGEDVDASAVTGDTRDAVLYRVQLEDRMKTDVRWRDIRPF